MHGLGKQDAYKRQESVANDRGADGLRGHHQLHLHPDLLYLTVPLCCWIYGFDTFCVTLGN